MPPFSAYVSISPCCVCYFVTFHTILTNKHPYIYSLETQDISIDAAIGRLEFLSFCAKSNLGTKSTKIEDLFSTFFKHVLFLTILSNLFDPEFSMGG